MSVNTKKLGKAIYEYFLQRTSPNENFKLCIDTYTYEHCAHQAGLNDKEIESLLSGEGINYIDDNYCALAIAALETKIAYDVETESNLVNSYNSRLIDKLRNFKDNNDVQQFYKDSQDVIWLKSKKLFETEKRYLKIPVPKTGPGCYVQYPLSQRIVNGTFIINYADKFIALHLEPASGITYQIFEGLVFNRNKYSNMIRRMIFSFYCVWDGRNSKDILNRKKPLSREQIEQKAKDEFLIQLEPEIKFYINKKQIDLTRDELNDKYLWKFDDSKYLSKKGSYFIKDSDYNDWLPYNRAIEPEEEVLIITTQTKYPSYVEDLRKTEEIEILSAGLYKVLLLKLNNKNSFEIFNISVKLQPYFTLLGGLKVKRNTYYSFALPSVTLTDQKIDKEKYKSVYFDSKEYPIIEGIVQLPEKIPSGKHCLKLLNSWDSSEMFFSVEDETVGFLPKDHGWILNEEEKELKPSPAKEESVIAGLKLLKSLKLIERNPVIKNKANENNLRPFLQQIKKVENRFEMMGNRKLNERGRYGN